MDSQKLKVIQQLMEELASDMEYSSDDLEHRLGRKKPDAGVTVLKVEGKGMPEMEEGEDEECMEEGPEHMAESFGGEESPEDSLKKRLMKLRG